MIEKIKQNPKRLLGIIAGVFFIAAILFMLLPGLSVVGQNGEEGTITISLFSLAFGGKISVSGELISGTEYNLKSSVNALNLITFILLILIIVAVVVLLYGLFSEKFSKKALIILSSVVVVLAITSAILTFVCKESALNAGIDGMVRSIFSEEYPGATEEMIQQVITMFKGKITEASSAGYIAIKLGAGAIVTPIMALLGACSLGGVICLSAKEAK